MMTAVMPNPMLTVAQRFAPKELNPLVQYYDDPVGFAENVLEWEEDEGLTEYQKEVLAAIPNHGRVCVRSLHGAGKTTIVAIAVLWFAMTRDAACVDWKCPTTAGAWRQLKFYTWKEIHKFAKRIRWDVAGRTQFNSHELLLMELNLSYGSAFAVASDDPAYIEGVHADAVFYLFDESKAISEAIFDAAEGAFSGTGEALALAVSTPGEPVGRFYQIQSKQAGYVDWHVIHVSLERAVASGRVLMSWAEKRARQWGKNSAIYFNRVLGEFRASDEDGVIPISWIEAAVERWLTKVDEAGNLLEPLGHLTAVGADIARSGDDKTILALRYGNRIQELRETFHEDTMETAGKLGGVLIANPGAVAVVDTDGVGAGVTDKAREAGHNVIAFHGGAKTDMRDKSGELGMLNTRAGAWWKLRELLDPQYDENIELPDDPILIGDLCAPHWKVVSNSRIQIESKDEIKKRLGRSTDRGDSVVQAFWEERKKRKRQMYDATDLGQPRRPPRIEQVGRTSRMHAA